LQKLTSTIGLIGFVLIIIGLFNKSKTVGNRVMKIGSIIMAIAILLDCSLGFYDGFTGYSQRD